MGYFEHCSIISADNSTVQRVVLNLKRDTDFDRDQEGLIEATPPTPLRSVTHVTIGAVDGQEIPLNCPYELGPQFYWRLASFFPNITHLDIVLGQRVVGSLRPHWIISKAIQCRNIFAKALRPLQNFGTSVCENTGSTLFEERVLRRRPCSLLDMKSS
jgi:hypothetical protein